MEIINLATKRTEEPAKYPTRTVNIDFDLLYTFEILKTPYDFLSPQHLTTIQKLVNQKKTKFSKF